MFRKPVFWIAFAALSVGATMFTIANFSTAFPLVSLDIQMDREGALTSARELAMRYAWPPEDYDQAVAFSGNPEVQNFIELEGGGKGQLAQVLEGDFFSPYTWEVRHFRESDAHETRIRFTPEGEPYGFSVRLPEQEAGAAIERDEARAIAESAATADWNVELAPYALVESSQEEQPGGRRDHTFIYERRSERLGEGRYRLRLVVGGDRLTDLTHFVQVPEAFSRRYQEMRSANDTIGSVAAIAMVLLYLLGGCGVGLFFLMRKRRLIWRQPVVWGLAVSVLVGLSVLNAWPQIWMTYDTALSASGFAAQQAALALGTVVLMFALMGVSFMAAESLSRRAFPHHVQLWRVWSSPAAASKPILGQLTAGYLLVGVFFAYEVLLYAFGHRTLGWWSPSDMLVNPDLFGTYFPFLPAVANSLQAGFWEECLFRAVPLACAALIGEKLGARRGLIVLTMIVQALIFGAGHAGYATQPAYARVVELIIPSFAFGGLYLAFGLLPGIILHYAFDLVWFAMPIFMSSSPRARFEQIAVLILAFVPLGITLLARLRAGTWTELPTEERNASWAPPPAGPTPVPSEPPPERTTVSPAVARLLPVAGALGVLAWLAFSGFGSDTPSLAVSRSDAERAAREVLNERGVQLDEAWRALSWAPSQPGESHTFVWRTAGREAYRQLLGTYLAKPHWVVRFARFEGDVAARAEEYQVSIGEDERILRLRHVLAEGTPGPELGEEEARRIAESAATEFLQVPIDSFSEVSAESQKRPERLDWTFQFADERDYGLDEGQARISVAIAGDEVADVTRYVFVPEEWARQERARRNLPDILSIGCIVLLASMVGAGAIAAVIGWARRRAFSVWSAAVVFLVLLAVNLIALINNWPASTGPQLSTAQPYLLQVGVILVVNVIALLFLSLTLGLISGSVMRSPTAGEGLRRSLLLGASLGALLTGVSAFGDWLIGPSAPEWPGFQGVAAWLPFLTNVFGPVNTLMAQTLVLAVVIQGTDFLSSHWRKRKNLSIAMLVLIGVVIAGTGIETLSGWLISGVAAGLLLAGSYVLVLRHSFAVLPAAAATIVILNVIRSGAAQAYPLALPGALAGAVLAGVMGWAWVRWATTANRANKSSPEKLKLRKSASE